METKLTEQESLSIISEMIEQARNNFRKGSGNSMIFYGIVVSALAILNVIAALVLTKLNIHPNYSFWMWCLMIPVIYIGTLIQKKVERESMVKTHLDSIISSTWKGYIYSVYLFFVIIFCIGLGKKMYDVFYLINPVLLVFVGLAEFVSAKTYRFKPYFYGAITMWAGALACVALMWTPMPVILQFFVLAFCMFFGFVIPGLKLNKLAKENV
ncbi:MAG: hypothetical protein LBE91_15750 [Tannerella sp.]|jgi:hypothetical protein|nr:hypothetical protein [Tannerella sp.]